MRPCTKLLTLSPLESQVTIDIISVVRPEIMTGRALSKAVIMPSRPAIMLGIISGIIPVTVTIALMSRLKTVLTKSGKSGPIP